MNWSRTRLVFIVLGIVLPITAYVIPLPTASIDFQPLWYALHPVRVPLWLIPIASLFALVESRCVSFGYASCIVFWLTGVWTRVQDGVANGFSTNASYLGQFDGWPLILFLAACIATFLMTPVPLVRQKAPVKEKVEPPTYQAW
jgi:hypothetical protein